jgi:hypothetical protein
LYPEKNIVIQLNKIEKSSFELHLIFELLEEALPLFPVIFEPRNYESIRSIFEILTDLYNLRNLLKGEKPQNIQNVENGVMVNGDVGNLTVNNINYNMYTENQKVNKEMIEHFRKLNDDNNINGVNISEMDKKYIDVVRDDFENFTNENKSLQEDSRIQEVDDTKLIIAKVPFDKKHLWKWYFIYQGNIISARITDVSFNEKMDIGESFSMGDCLKVKLLITQAFDRNLDTYVNKNYEITEVYKHIRRGEQSNLDI